MAHYGIRDRPHTPHPSIFGPYNMINLADTSKTPRRTCGGVRAVGQTLSACTCDALRWMARRYNKSISMLVGAHQRSNNAAGGVLQLSRQEAGRSVAGGYTAWKHGVRIETKTLDLYLASLIETWLISTGLMVRSMLLPVVILRYVRRIRRKRSYIVPRWTRVLFAFRHANMVIRGNRFFQYFLWKDGPLSPLLFQI